MKVDRLDGVFLDYKDNFKAEIAPEAAQKICADMIISELMDIRGGVDGIYTSLIVCLSWFGTTDQISQYCSWEGITYKEFRALVDRLNANIPNRQEALESIDRYMD